MPVKCGHSSLTNEKDHHYFLKKGSCVLVSFLMLTRKILALNSRLQIEQVSVIKSTRATLDLVLRSLGLLYASQTLFLFFHRELLLY